MIRNYSTYTKVSIKFAMCLRAIFSIKDRPRIFLVFQFSVCLSGLHFSPRNKSHSKFRVTFYQRHTLWGEADWPYPIRKTFWHETRVVSVRSSGPLSDVAWIFHHCYLGLRFHLKAMSVRRSEARLSPRFGPRILDVCLARWNRDHAWV